MNPKLWMRHETEERAEAGAAWLAEKYQDQIFFLGTDNLVATHTHVILSVPTTR